VRPEGEGGFLGIHVLVDAAPCWKLDPVEQAAAACLGGAPVIQLRAKDTIDSLALRWAREIRAQTREYGVRFVVNDRFDLALAADADAVHLGQDDVPPSRVPKRAGRRLAIGRSTHTPEQVRQARLEPIDYLAFGPVFGTRSKVSAHAARGLAALSQAVQLAQPLPVIAIGGIDAEKLGALRDAGAAGAAVIRCVAGADDPVAATRRLVAGWRAAGGA